MENTVSTPTPGTRPVYRCTFCGKTQEQVDLLLAGTRGAYICEQCVELCHAQVQEYRRAQGNDTAATEEQR
jgi:ATP-dependent Clp protease ATP-binding subunit ClpX